jgi:hypothetical protein
MLMKNPDYPFALSHLDQFETIDGPETLMVKNMTPLDYNVLYRGDGNPRWILQLKAITTTNLELIKQVSKKVSSLTYQDIGHLLMTGVIWENQIKNAECLPVKGEYVHASFDYVKGILRCTNISVITRRVPVRYDYKKEMLDEITNFEKMVKQNG